MEISSLYWEGAQEGYGGYTQDVKSNLMKKKVITQLLKN